MPNFHETNYGNRFFNHQLPEISRTLARVATALEQNNQTMGKLVEALTALDKKKPKPHDDKGGGDEKKR